jgi:ankyrin repeat protein
LSLKVVLVATCQIEGNLESKDAEYGWTPLSWAAENEHKVVVELLLEKGADLESKDAEYGWTPLSWAAGNGESLRRSGRVGNGE